MPSNWSGEHIRLTFFPATPLEPERTSGIWQEFAGTPPEEDEFRRTVGLRRQKGPFLDDLVLELQARPARIDLVVKLPDPKEPNIRTDFDNAEERLEQTIAALTKWLPRAPAPFSRLALGMVLVAPVASREEGYKTINRLVPSVNIKNNGDIADFLFQINRRKSSRSVEGITLNRLMKWSVVEVRLFQFEISTDGLRERAGMPIRFQVRLELDINTAASSGTLVNLDSGPSTAIFMEFFGTAKAIAAEGELA